MPPKTSYFGQTAGLAPTSGSALRPMHPLLRRWEALSSPHPHEHDVPERGTAPGRVPHTSPMLFPASVSAVPSVKRPANSVPPDYSISSPLREVPGSPQVISATPPPSGPTAARPVSAEVWHGRRPENAPVDPARSKDNLREAPVRAIPPALPARTDSVVPVSASITRAAAALPMPPADPLRAEPLRPAVISAPPVMEASSPPQSRHPASSVHIGTVEVHLLPAPVPAPLPAVRPKPAAPSVPLSRGYGPTLGLSQS